MFYTCNKPECLEHAEIVRENLKALGIELEIRRFSFGAMFARLANPDEPFDLSVFGWIGWTPDPSEFFDVMFRLGRDLADQAAPLALAVSGAHTDFFSAHIGCQVEDPLYGIDFAALCVRD